MSDKLAAVPALSLIATPLARLTAVAASEAMFCPAPHGVAEGQRLAARTADVGRCSAVVQGERRRAPRRPSPEH